MAQSPFVRSARRAADLLGHPGAFGAAVGVVLLWLVLGPVFRFSNAWQLVINTATTIVTFLMVFLIQNTQNREGAATQVKLDELLRAIEGAHTRLVALEDVSDEELKAIRESYRKLAEKTRADVKAGSSDTHAPEVQSLGEGPHA